MRPDWIAIDWGTSNLRIWAMDAAGNVLAEKRSDEGMAGLAPLEFEPTLLAHIAQWLADKPIPVIACGMVGARQGWQEAPYDMVPTQPATKTIRVNAKDPRLELSIISGIKQTNPADVMRGEETQISGFIASNPDYEGVLCMPGTHCKWAKISSRQINGFQTALTGELFALISKGSVLRHSLGEWDDACFLNCVMDAYERPENMTMELFNIRAKNLLEGDECGVARLSGSLIGAELAGTKRMWKNRNVTVIGAGELARLYGLALGHLGVKAQTLRASDLTIEGLKQVHRELYE